MRTEEGADRVRRLAQHTCAPAWTVVDLVRPPRCTAVRAHSVTSAGWSIGSKRGVDAHAHTCVPAQAIPNTCLWCHLRAPRHRPGGDTTTPSGGPGGLKVRSKRLSRTQQVSPAHPCSTKHPRTASLPRDVTPTHHARAQEHDTGRGSHVVQYQRLSGRGACACLHAAETPRPIAPAPRSLSPVPVIIRADHGARAHGRRPPGKATQTLGWRACLLTACMYTCARRRTRTRGAPSSPVRHQSCGRDERRSGSRARLRTKPRRRRRPHEPGGRVHAQWAQGSATHAAGLTRP